MTTSGEKAKSQLGMAFNNMSKVQEELVSAIYEEKTFNLKLGIEIIGIKTQLETVNLEMAMIDSLLKEMEELNPSKRGSA